jgi:cobalt/nickel transport system permease protein
MHALDGFFAVWLSLLGWLISLSVIGLALRKTRTQLGERQVPLMGLLAAAIFAGQMLNFSIPGGTSGHLLGGALAAALLGPWGGALVMTPVIAVQALVFQDGGLGVMGLNILNMGIVTSFSGYAIYRPIMRRVRGRAGLLIGGFVSGWVSMELTAAFVAVELALSGTSALNVALPVMLIIHAVIGIGEGLLTAFALNFILAARPDLLQGGEAPAEQGSGWVLGGLVAVLSLVLLAPLASPYADGLTKFAQAAGISTVQGSPYQLLAHYTIPTLGNTSLSTIVAGVIGVLIVFAAAYGIAQINKRMTRDS